MVEGRIKWLKAELMVEGQNKWRKGRNKWRKSRIKVVEGLKGKMVSDDIKE
ncbi:hypothetical protein ABEY41_20435 [Peribacillus butanolivorans]|uniref:hypothetical protein n=1 Tax=Peribacillus butanolivorans TaxID=421767 RepID=UPI003D2AE0EB